MTRTLYRGGFVLAPAGGAPAGPAQALVTDGPAIAWVGSADDAARIADAADEIVELDGGLVTPAFVDAHVHVTETGLLLTGVDLRGAASVEEALDLVAAAARHGRGRPILGHGWDERRWPQPRPPTRFELDRASAGGVVYLARVDVHSAVISSALAHASGANKLPGWTDDGRVERDAHHAARAMTRQLAPGRRTEVQRAALAAAAAAGIGTVHEMGAPHIAPMADLAALLTLPGPRPAVVPYWGELVRDRHQARDLLDRLPEGVRGLAGDLCVDGSIGSRTAAFREDYTDTPGHPGHLYLSVDDVAAHLRACAEVGVQAGFHVIGDAAIDVAVEGLRRAGSGLATGERPAVRLEHLEAADGPTIEALAESGVTASVQPAFDAAWGGEHDLYAERLGPRRAVRLNPFAALAAAGVPLALGSDSPVTPFDPWGAVAACASHRTAAHRLPAAVALQAHTIGAHRAAGDRRRGLLAAGSPADLAVWTVPAVDETGLPDLSPGAARPVCRRTVVDGVTVFDETA